MIGVGRAAAVAFVGCLAACSGGAHIAATARAAPIPRRTVVWVGAEGLDATAAADLQRVGVDEVVVRRGSVSLAGGSPVVRLQQPAPPVETSLPVGISLTLEGAPGKLDPELADRVWTALAGELGGDSPAELLLDVPVVSTGMDRFVARLAAAAGVPVVPVLLPDQLGGAGVPPMVAAARSCLVPAFGELALLREGAKAQAASLEVLLAPLAASGARVRVGVVLTPTTEPPLGQWGEPIDSLCHAGVTEISTTSRLDRTFTFQKEVTWSGRAWHRGESLAARWVDAPRLNAHLAEIGHVVLPELGGWDLINLPPTAQALGIGRETLVRYLGGDGPVPEFVVRPARSGGGVSVRVDNPSPFATAVSSFGNWVEVSVEPGVLVADERGSFDRVVLGTVRGGEWRQSAAGGADAVRFLANLIGPGQSVETGLVRLPGGRGRVVVRWQVVLSTGEAMVGEQRL